MRWQLASLVISMIERYRKGVIPAGARNQIDADDAADYATYHASMDGARGYLLSDALRAVWQTVMRANEYVDRQAPWKLAKDPAAGAELDLTLSSLARQLVRQAVHVAPFIPAKSEELWRQLGGPGSCTTSGSISWRLSIRLDGRSRGATAFPEGKLDSRS